jgi:hypothetical protein
MTWTHPSPGEAGGSDKAAHIAQKGTLRLSPSDQHVLAEALLALPTPGPSLLRAFVRRSELLSAG